MRLLETLSAAGFAGGTVTHRSESGGPGAFNPAPHIGNASFAKSLREVLKGDLDRTVVPARKVDGAGKPWLKQA
jgi:hypothetical protein